MIVYFIYCDDCVDCKYMEKIVWGTLNKLGVEYTKERFNCETDAAIDVAIEHDVEDVPACIFLNNDSTESAVYSGPGSCQVKDVEHAIKTIGK